MQQTIQEWKELGRETLVKKFGRGIDLVKFQMPDGTEADFSLMTAGGNSVTILALTEDSRVILARQFRPGPSKILLEMPGGGVNTDEAYDVAAARELLEETGYQAETVEYAGGAWMTAYSTWRGNVCVARNCKKIAEPVFDEHEYAETVLVSLDEFRELLRSGEMTDVANGYRALDFLGLL